MQSFSQPEKTAKTISGQILIEPILAIAIFGIILVPFLSSISNVSSAQVKYRHQTEAVQYAREGLEIIYNQAVNAEKWDSFLGDHLGTDEEMVGGRYTREIIVSEVRRSGGEIVENGGDDLDENTVKAVCQVSWAERGRDQSVELVTYLINFKQTFEE